MKKNYSTLNEEINRIKSLFSESRLYGNLVEKEVITEQKRFFSNLTDAFKVTLKTFDQLDSFTKFLNRDINNIDDIIKHVNDFDELWRIILPKTDMAAIVKNLNKFKQVTEAKKLRNIPEDVFLNKVLPGFPERGGMRDMIYDFWLEANGKSRNFPQKVETRLVKTNPSTGELVIGITNQKGMVTYKNKRGEVVLIEKDPNAKTYDTNVDNKPDEFKPDIEDVDWVDVTEGTPLEGLDGKTVRGTDENIENLFDSMHEKSIEAEKEGKKTVVSFTFEGDGSDEIAKEFMSKFGDKNSVKMSEDMTEEIAEDAIREGRISREEKSKFKSYIGKFLKNWLTKWPTKHWFNPLAIGEGIFRSSDSTWDKMREYGTKVTFRTTILVPTTLFVGWSTYRSFNQDRSLITGYIADASLVVKSIQNWFKNLFDKEDVLAGIEASIRILSDGKLDTDIIKNNLTNAAISAITGATTGDSFITCEDIINSSDDEIIKKAFDKIKDEENARISKILSVEGSETLDIDKLNEIKSKTKTMMKIVIDNGLLGGSKFNTLVRRTRTQCVELGKKKAIEEEENKALEEETIEVVVDGGVI